jgi:hypothetical protein
MEKNVLINHSTGKEYELKPLGDVSGGVWRAAAQVACCACRAHTMRAVRIARAISPPRALAALVLPAPSMQTPRPSTPRV